VLLGSRQFHPRGAGSQLRLVGGLGWDADRLGTWLDLGGEGGGLADDVAVELVVVLSVDPDPHPFPCAGRPSSFLARRVMSRRPSLTQCRNRRGEAIDVGRDGWCPLDGHPQGSRPSAFAAATKYAAEPTLSFKSSSSQPATMGRPVRRGPSREAGATLSKRTFL
jgi:hypothetical protein